MGKKRRVKEASDTQRPGIALDAVLRCGIIVLLIAVTLVPCDSVAVEQGTALAFTLLAIPLATLAYLLSPQGPSCGRTVEWLFAGLVLWMTMATFLVAGNLRFATNEIWLWFTLWATFVASRRAFGTLSQRRTLVTILIGLSVIMTCFTLYQKFISIPETIRLYELDPEATLNQIGIVAPQGSAMRYQFEGRLYASEASGTFSLSSSAGGFLLLGFTLLAVQLRHRRDERYRSTTIALSAIAASCLVGMFVTGSKIAGVLVAVVCIGIITLRWVGQKADLHRWLQGIGVALITGPIAAAIAMSIVPEWLKMVPLAIRFRFHYWNSTLAMLMDSPIAGVGPGNFKTAYTSYRAPEMSEQIADPHNFVWESFSAGGVPGMVLISVMLWLLINAWNQRSNGPQESQSQPGFSVGLLVSAIGGVLCVTILGLIFGFSPDLVPLCFGMIAAVGCIWVLRAWAESCDSAPWDIPIACIVLLMFLSLSGGWTVPGLAVPFWVLAGVSCSSRCSEEAESDRSGKWLVITAGAALLVAVIVTSLNPVLQRDVLISAGYFQNARGHRDSAEQLFEDATLVDRWGTEGPRALVAHYGARILLEDSQDARSKFERSAQALFERDTQNASGLRLIGEAYLKLYRRWGQDADLLESANWYTKAVYRDPNSIVLNSQLAVVLDRLRDERAMEYWKTMEYLSEVNQNTESHWSLLFVIPATTADIGHVSDTISLENAHANRFRPDSV